MQSVPLEWEQGPLLGSGGMADVFLATVRDAAGPRFVALKRLRAGVLDPKLVAQLEREAKIGSLLHHPNVVRVEAYGQDDKGPWLAMEYVAGRSVRRLIRAHLELSRLIDPRLAATIACDAAKGLAYVHGLHVPDQGLHDLVHRDISSDNILVGLDGRSKLADFGVARISGIVGLTRSGAFKGKVAYAAPELLEGASPTHRSDYFALAATVYELFTGRYAFAGKSEVETLNNVVNQPAPQLTNAPSDVAEWVSAALEKNPKHRPDSLTGLVLALNRMAAPHAEVAAALHELGIDAGVQRADAITTQLSKGPRGRRRGLIAAGLASAALASFGLRLLLAPAPQPVPPAPRVVDVAKPTPAPPPDEPPPQPHQPALAPAPRPKSSARTALVKFTVKPWAYVWHNGKKLGIAPFEARVPLGRQEFEVRNPELDRALMTTFEVRADGPNELVLDLYQ